MARKTAFTVHVRRTEPANPKRPELGDTIVQEETFPAGSTLPSWAKGLVGDHVYGDSEDDGSPSEPDSTDDDKPAGNASLEAWQEYARSQGATSGEIDGKTRGELREQFGS